MYSQDKTQAYYSSHEREILPDAKAAFRAGRYERSAELCRWHYVIVGDRSADSLREQSERCAGLATRMESLRGEGKLSEARAAAEALLAANPNDAAARKFLKELDAPAAPPVPATDTVKVVAPVETPIVHEEKPEPKPEPKLEPVKDIKPNPAREPVTPSANRIVVKVGVTVVDLKQFAVAPEVGVGFYDISGTPFGVDAAISFCPSLSGGTASMFGADAALVFRAADGIYPKAGFGFFSCSPSGSGEATHGLCAGVGVSILIGGHFCVEAGVKYYPKVMVQGVETVSTSGASYIFPAPLEVLSGGIAPTVKLGWAF